MNIRAKRTAPAAALLARFFVPPLSMPLIQSVATSTIRTIARLAGLNITFPITDNTPTAWGAISPFPHDRTSGEIQELYLDTLAAWRKNPLAKRIVDITTDYVIGDGITLSSPNRSLNKFIEEFWYHPQNNMPLRLEGICEELTRAGNYIPIMFRNPNDGMSYVRAITVDQVQEIRNLPNDWETITHIISRTPGNINLSTWETIAAATPETAHIATLYTINKPIGAQIGEGDLVTVIPWLLRYSRMLEDRVKLNWAVRSFLWFVKVSADKVSATREKYKEPPESGSIIVHDDAEEWEVKAPTLHANDAAHDLAATRRMIYSGTSYPPHWYGEQGSNLAEAKASQAPAERHLRRRQLHIESILSDMTLTAYRRAVPIRNLRPLPITNPNTLIKATNADLSREDNAVLAEAANQLSNAYKNLILETAPQSRTLTEEMLKLLFHFAGSPKPESLVKQMVDEMFVNAEKDNPAPHPPL